MSWPRRQQLNLLAFLQNANVVLIRDADEYAWFVQALRRMNLVEILPGREPASYGDLLAQYRKEANLGVRYLTWDGKTLYAECQIGKESIGIYPYEGKAVAEWYGVDPLTVADVLDPGAGASGAQPPSSGKGASGA